MRQAEKLSLDQIRAFLKASEEVQFEGEKREEIYGWVSQTLQTHSYGKRKRAERGLLRSYIAKLTGLSRAASDAADWALSGMRRSKSAKVQAAPFAASYTRADVELLAAVDEAHDTLSGPATKRILEREHAEYGKKE